MSAGATCLLALAVASLQAAGGLATEPACAAGAAGGSCQASVAASGDVVLLQKRYSASLGTSSSIATPPVNCHTTVEGEECWKHVNWAKNTGIFHFKEWYPSLDESSTFEEFQEFLHEKGQRGCPAPCITPVGETTTPAATTTAVVNTPAHPVHPVGDLRVKLTAFNVYYAALGKRERTDGIGKAIAQLDADIAVITEQWNEKPAILERVRQVSGRNYKFCDSGPQEKFWDGDILYDSDLWVNLKDGVKDWGANRGLSWALLQHRERGHRLLVYGAHPVCCGNEKIHLQNAVDFAAHVRKTHPEWSEVPVVYMGDFNALEHWSSTKLYKHGHVHAYGRHWQLPMTFVDTFRDAPGNSWKDATTHNSGARLDYIFAERRNPPAFQTLSASIWRQAPGKSDHYPISAELLLKR